MSCVGSWVPNFTAEEFMNQLMPIFESLRQREDLPCSYPLAMGSSGVPSYHLVNKDGTVGAVNVDSLPFVALSFNTLWYCGK